MEIRRLAAEDYDELLAVLNKTFGNKYGREMDFLSTQPKMWVKDDRHMGMHLGAFEDGVLAAVVGIYPLPAFIGGKEVLFATTGNVATLPEYEGRGYFTKLFTLAVKEAEEMGAVAARLGGARQRYSRYGFEPAGLSYKFSFNETNRIKGLGDKEPNITFREIERGDTEYLAYCKRIAESGDFYVTRSDEDSFRDVYLALTTTHCAPYIALREGKPVGYLSSFDENVYIGKSSRGRNIREIRAEKEGDLIPIISAWQSYVGTEITVALPPHLYGDISKLVSVAESVSVSSPSRFKIYDYEKLADALIGLKLRDTLPVGEENIGINGYGTLKLYNNGKEAGCIRTSEPAKINLEPAVATRVLFGTLTAEVQLFGSPFLSALLPLPLSWSTLDYV